MSVQEARGRITARVWKAIAQSDLDLSAVPKPTLESLVGMVTDAALLEIDDEIEKSLAAGKADLQRDQPPKSESQEEVLWEGRPFLSITKQYVITNERIRIIDGLLGKDREDVELIRVQDIDQSQNLGERLLNVGDIRVLSHDSSHPEIVLNNIRDPQTVHEILRRAVLNAREKYRLIYREEM